MRVLETTSYEPNELSTGVIAAIPTISGSSREDIYQFYDVQKEFGEQDQQAPVMEVMRGFGQIQHKAYSITR